MIIILCALLFFIQHLVIPTLFLVTIFAFIFVFIIQEVENMEDCPCDSCEREAYCDGWEAQFCCAFCLWSGAESCEDCDPYDI